MENPACDLGKVTFKMVQALDKLHSTRLWLDRESPEWITLLEIEAQIYKALSDFRRRIDADENGASRGRETFPQQ